MIEFLPQNEGHLVAVSFKGKVTHEEIEALTPMIDAQIDREGGSICLLLDLLEFEGWEDLHAVWDHFILVKNHHKFVTRIAILGHEDWERRFAEYAVRFTFAEVGYYEKGGRETAIAWLTR